MVRRVINEIIYYMGHKTTKQSLLNGVLACFVCLACSRVWHALVLYVLACLRAWRAS